MGITVLSAASLNSPGKGAASPSPTEGGGSVDFATLLGLQISSPQLLGMQLEAATGAQSATDPRDVSAESAGDDAAAGLDMGAFLAAAGLLPASMAPQRPLDGTKAALEGKDESDAGRGQIEVIVGQQGSATGQGPDMEAIGVGAKNSQVAALADNLLRADTANIAADAKPESGGEQNFAATLAAQSAQVERSHSRNENSAAATVSTPIHDNRWSQDFGEKVVWLAKNNQQVAQININPPQLGPMQITLNMNGDQASALFVSPHAEVRQAIQDAMPQLREMLAGAGINLGQADVGAQLAQQNSGEQQQPRFSGSSRADEDNAILRAENGQGSTIPPTITRGGRGMVDLFA